MVIATPGRFNPGKETRYPLYRTLGRLQCRSGRCGKSRDPTGIRSPYPPGRSESLYRLSHRGPWRRNEYLRFDTISFPSVWLIQHFVRFRPEICEDAWGVLSAWSSLVRTQDQPLSKSTASEPQLSCNFLWFKCRPWHSFRVLNSPAFEDKRARLSFLLTYLTLWPRNYFSFKF